jgi:hypothetical protein
MGPPAGSRRTWLALPYSSRVDTKRASKSEFFDTNELQKALRTVGITADYDSDIVIRADAIGMPGNQLLNALVLLVEKPLTPPQIQAAARMVVSFFEERGFQTYDVLGVKARQSGGTSFTELKYSSPRSRRP